LIHFSHGAAQLQPYDKARNAVALALSPVVRALIDPDGALRDIRDLDSVRAIMFLFLLVLRLVAQSIC
jgi:hypothetical protein